MPVYWQRSFRVYDLIIIVHGSLSVDSSRARLRVRHHRQTSRHIRERSLFMAGRGAGVTFWLTGVVLMQNCLLLLSAGLPVMPYSHSSSTDSGAKSSLWLDNLACQSIDSWAEPSLAYDLIVMHSICSGAEVAYDLIIWHASLLTAEPSVYTKSSLWLDNYCAC